LIFVTVGSQKFQFNRLLRELDTLVEQKRITEDIFAQTGYSDYIPKNYKYKSFLDRDEFKEVMEISNKVITHGGTGAIIGAVKQGKKTIVVPRLKEFGEHVDNHQIQIMREFTKLRLIASVERIDDLEIVINEVDVIKPKSYISNTKNVINSIEKFIEIAI
jgi:UDP-N-acetylglucosamine transferase subunit ALG13